MNCGHVEIWSGIVVRRRHLTCFPVDFNALIAVVELPIWIIQTPLEMALSRHHPVNGADDNERSTQVEDLGHPWFPNPVLKGRLNNDRDLTGEILIHYFKEKIGDHAIGVRRKLIVLDAMGIDIASLISSRLMTGIHNRSASLLAKLVFPDPGRPVTIMHLGLLLISAVVCRFQLLLNRRPAKRVGCAIINSTMANPIPSR